MQLATVNYIFFAVSHDSTPEVREDANRLVLVRPRQFAIALTAWRFARQFIPHKPPATVGQLAREMLSTKEANVLEPQPGGWIERNVVAFDWLEISVLANHVAIAASAVVMALVAHAVWWIGNQCGVRRPLTTKRQRIAVNDGYVFRDAAG